MHLETTLASSLSTPVRSPVGTLLRSFRSRRRARRELVEPRRSQPLHEALAIGLGCDAFSHKWVQPDEWR